VIVIELFFIDPKLKIIGFAKPNAFFVCEAKAISARLYDHIPQAIGEMFACLKSLQ
jgi:hypothetical protein